MSDTVLHTLLESTALVFFSEMGDKTQLLALVLSSRFQKPWAILAGILVATLANHALAAWLGAGMAATVSVDTRRWILTAIFLGFAIWILIPDKDSEVNTEPRFGAFLTTVVIFFFAEMGDKTQLATVALGAKFPNPVLVTLGTTIGMMGANAPAVFFGDKFAERIPMRYVRWFASALFVLFAALLWVAM